MRYKTYAKERDAVYLTGSKKHTLDAKVRLTLPADFRREFDREVCLVPAQSALYGFTPEGHKAWVENSFPEGFNPRSASDDKLRRFLNGQTVRLDIDSAGRIALGKIPEKIREQFGLDQDVMVVGNDDHFEIWNPDRWEESQASFEEDFSSIMFTED